MLDTALGRPAAGVAVTLRDASGAPLAERVTDADGRVAGLPVASAGVFSLSFDTAAYFAASGRRSFYPRVEVCFEVLDPAEHHHVPLLVAPYGYSTYRGS